MQRGKYGTDLALLIPFILIGGLLTALTLLSKSGSTPAWQMVALLIAAHVPYAFCLYCSRERKLLPPLALIASALMLRLVLVPASPTLSDDVYRYTWDGLVTLDGTNPYSFAPDSPALSRIEYEHKSSINNSDLRTIYPPGAQLIFAAESAIVPSIYTFKLTAALADTGVVCMVFLLAGGALRRQRMAVRSEDGTAILAGLAYGLNPLACTESAMSGHLEPFAILPALVAIHMVGTKRGCGSPITGSVAGAACLALSIGIKILPVLLLPYLARERRSIWLLTPLFILLLALPFGGAGTHALESLDTFARRWEGNAGLFALVKGGTEAGLLRLVGSTDPETLIHIPFMDGPAGALQDTFFSLHKDGGWDASRPGAFPVRDLALAAGKTVSLLVVGAAALFTLVRRFPPGRAALWVFGALLISTPVLHPWYLLWVLPFASGRGTWPWFLFGALLPLAYVPLDGWWANGNWYTPTWIPVTEYGGLVLSALVFLKASQQID